MAKTSTPPRRTRQGRRGENAASSRTLSRPWSLRRSGGLRILELAAFKRLPWLVHGFSTRTGGVSTLDGHQALNLSFMGWDGRENVLQNQRLFQSAVHAKEFRLLAIKQIHSDVIHAFAEVPVEVSQGDGSATDRPGLLLGVETADCVPILLVDPKKRAVAAVHAGWRGTLARIAEKAVGRMQLEFGSKPANLLAALGPAIGPCCYEVGTELVTKFTAQFADGAEYFDEPRSGDEPNPLEWLNMAPPGHRPPPRSVHLDLRKANRSQLLAAGLRPRNLFASDLCTACRGDLLFSYRKEGPQSGRLLSVVGIRPSPAG